jgi:hypothetical protein
MKDLIQQIRNADGTELGYTLAHMAKDAADALEQQAAVIEAMREALGVCKSTIALAGWQGDYSYSLADQALALQPCPEVLAKVKADAVIAFASPYRDGSEIFGENIKIDAEDYAQRLVKGEV